MHNSHHPRAEIQRLYIPTCEGGRGLMEVDNTYKREIISLYKYLTKKTEKFYQVINFNQNQKN